MEYRESARSGAEYALFSGNTIKKHEKRAVSCVFHAFLLYGEIEALAEGLPHQLIMPPFVLKGSEAVLFHY